MDYENLLKDIYYKDKNFDGANELYRKARLINKTISKSQVLEWLNKQLPAQRTSQQIKSKNDYLPIYSDAPNSFQIDLTFFDRYKNQNNGYYILFTAININSRFVYAYPAKNKDMDTILKFLEEMNKKNEIDNITCDEGSEFKNQKFIKYCEDNEINLYFVKGDSHKLGIINRFHRTLKEKLTKYFIAYDTVKWFDIIDDIIKNYNNSYNRGIGTTPENMNDFKQQELINEKKLKTDILRNDKIRIGDKIRMKEDKETFGDKMNPKYSKDIYTVVKINKNNIKVKKNDNEDELNLKKSKAKIIPPSIENLAKAPPSESKTRQEITNDEHRIEMRNKRAGINMTDIIETPRIRKPNPKYQQN